MTTPTRLSRRGIAVALGALLVYCALCVGSSLTKRPWSDEGWFANAAWNLMAHGSMGTPVLEPSDFLQGIDRYTYWTVPLNFVAQAAWYKVFGFGLLSTRSLSTFWGVLLMGAVFVIMRQLFRRDDVALLAVVLLAVDYVMVTGGSFGRMDMMCAALGFAAQASYLWLRERNLTQAVLVSQTLVVASGLTHFNGVLHLFALVFLALYFDRSRLRFRHVALALIPYVVGAVGWGLYILQAPSLFLTQFGGNARNMDRMSGLAAPLSAFKHEITRRYLVAYGLGTHSIGHTGPIALKSLVLVAYLVALAGIVAVRRLREQQGVRVLLVLTACFFLVMTLLDGQKLSYYLLHIVPLYTALLAVWLYWCWSERAVPRPVVAVCLAGLLLLQLGGVLYRMKINTYDASYAPAVSFLKQNARADSLIMGSAELGFALGFDRPLVDDYRLGYFSGKRPDFFVVDEIYEEAINGQQKHRPELYRHIRQTLDDDYRLVYDQSFYKIYARRDAPQTAAAGGQ